MEAIFRKEEYNKTRKKPHTQENKKTPEKQTNQNKDAAMSK